MATRAANWGAAVPKGQGRGVSVMNAFGSYFAMVADVTVDKGEVSQGLLPRGSALITTSGALKETGIISIIHAATGSMNQQGGHHEPTLESVKLSVRNSIALGEKFNHARIA
ncbi:MAG: hypothetical protein V4760_04880, partial [Bdellovibrionota bacterium]